MRSQEQDGGGQFLRSPDAVERSSRRELRPDRIRTFLRGCLRIDDRRVDCPGTNRVDTDAAVLEFRRPRANEGADSRLARTVGAVGREALEAQDRGNQNDAAAIAEERKRLLNSEQQAAGVIPNVLSKWLVVISPSFWCSTKPELATKMSIFPFSFATLA